MQTDLLHYTWMHARWVRVSARVTVRAGVRGSVTVRARELGLQ